MIRKLPLLVLAVVAVALFVAPAAALAQENAEAGGPTVGKGLGYLGVGLGMAFASGVAGLAQSRAIAAACEGVSRNPGAAGNIRGTMILGVAFIESLVLFAFLIMFVLLGKL